MKIVLKYLLIIFIFFPIYNLACQKLNLDTIFLLKNKEHIIFIDTSKESTFYNKVANFTYSDLNDETFESSLKYFKKNKIKLNNHKIKRLAKKWVIIKYYKNKFYTYYPSDFYNHYKISITDTAFIEFYGEGPVANKILTFRKNTDKKYSFLLTGEGKINRSVVFYIIDRKNGIAILEESYNCIKNYFFMIDATKIKQLPIIVNYCISQKQLEFNFEEPNYENLLKINIKKPHIQLDMWFLLFA